MPCVLTVSHFAAGIRRASISPAGQNPQLLRGDATRKCITGAPGRQRAELYAALTPHGKRKFTAAAAGRDNCRQSCQQTLPSAAQRVAVARALLTRQPLLLMNRWQVRRHSEQRVMQALKRRQNARPLMVTHQLEDPPTGRHLLCKMARLSNAQLARTSAPP